MSILYKPDRDLNRLERILTFDLEEFTPGFWFLSPTLTGYAWILISILATPFILWVLIKKRRYGWIISFLVLVLAPWVLTNRFVGGMEMGYLFFGFPLLLHYIYLFMLKQSYKDWREPIFINKRK